MLYWFCGYNVVIQPDLYTQTLRGSEAPCYSLNGALSFVTLLQNEVKKSKSNIMHILVVITTNKNWENRSLN